MRVGETCEGRNEGRKILFYFSKIWFLKTQLENKNKTNEYKQIKRRCKIENVTEYSDP